MIHKMSLRLAREKSKQLGIPYQNLLAGFARECIIECFMEKKEEFPFQVKESCFLGIQTYRDTLNQELYFGISEQCQEREKMEAVLKDVFPEYDYEISETDKEYKVHVQVKIDQLRMPIDVFFHKRTYKKNQTQEISLKLIYENEKSILIPCCSAESELADLFCQMSTQLELLSDMKVFETIVTYSKTRQFSGRNLQACMEEVLEKENITLTEQSIELLNHSMKSKHLQQRYDLYLREKKRKEPGYETVLQKIDKIYNPVLQSILKEEIYFGDWMPELERYL